MISLPNPTKTTMELSAGQRAYIAEMVAKAYLDAMSLKDLERFFYDIQLEYLQEYTDEELLNELEDYTSEEEFDEIVNFAA